MLNQWDHLISPNYVGGRRLLFMNRSVKRFLRTAQTYVPSLKEPQLAARRWLRNLTSIPHENDFRVIRLFPDDPQLVYIDVGANRGQSIDDIIMAKPNAIIHAFEPNGKLASVLDQRYKEKSNVNVHRLALGTENGRFSLFTPIYQGYAFDGLATSDETSAREWLVPNLIDFDARKLTIHKQQCSVARLDDFNFDPFFLKIDVEGMELQVLKGGEQTILRSEPIILIEGYHNNPDVRSFLKEIGYRDYGYRDNLLVAKERGNSPNTFLVTERRRTTMESLFMTS